MSSTDPQPISRETAHHLLSKSRRRHLLAFLFEKETRAVETLGRMIAARECDKRPENVVEGTCIRVVTSLIHCHVPLLADYGLVEYDRETKTVTLAETARERFPFRTDHDQFVASTVD